MKTTRKRYSAEFKAKVAHIDPPLAFECPSLPPIFVVLRRPVEFAPFCRRYLRTAGQRSTRVNWLGYFLSPISAAWSREWRNRGGRGKRAPVAEASLMGDGLFLIRSLIQSCGSGLCSLALAFERYH